MKTALLVIVFLERWLSQMLWQQFEAPELYYGGQAVFEAALIYLFSETLEGWQKSFIHFFMGLAFYNVIRELFLNPLEIDVAEYVGAIAGSAFLTYQLLRNGRTAQRTGRGS